MNSAPQTNQKSLFHLLFTMVLLSTSCSNSDSTISDQNPSENTNPTTSNFIIEPSNTFTYLKLSAEDFSFFNSNTINKTATYTKVETICKSQVYSTLKDNFDFIIFVMNNTNLPKDMPYGQYMPVKNDTKGIGLSMFNDTADYGSAGKLQGYYFLYTNNIDLGPVLHEMFHRWANYIVPQNYGTHWDTVPGILYSVSNNFADIELYLAGAIPADQIKETESLKIYNDARYTDKVRVPNSQNAQKSFKSLVVVMNPTDLTTTEINTFKSRIANITRTPTEGTTNAIYQNIYNKSKGLMTLTIGGLNLDKK